MHFEGDNLTEALDRPQFTQAEVLAVTALTAATLQTWVNRGLVALSEGNPGTGKRRQYSALDVVTLIVMEKLTKFGISISVASRLAQFGVAQCFADFPVDPQRLLGVPEQPEEPKGLIINTWMMISPWEGVLSDTFRQWYVADYAADKQFWCAVKQGRPEDIRLSDLGGLARSDDPARAGETYPTFLLLPIGGIVAEVLRNLRKLLKDEAQ